MLREVSLSAAPRLLRLPAPNRIPDNLSGRPANSASFQRCHSTTAGNSLAQTPEKLRNPYEQAYWLIAVASILVCVATTLTIRQAPPEFEPQYLNVKWQDQMMRRMFDHEIPAANHHVEEERP